MFTRTGIGTILDLANRGDHPIASRAAKEVDAFDPGEPLLKLLKQTACRRCHRLAARAGESASDLLRVNREGRVRLLARAPELFDQRVVRPGVDHVGRKHGGFPTGALDFRPQPLEVLSCVGGIREDVDCLFDGHCAELLQTPPGPDSQARRSRWQLVDEQQPAVARLDLGERCWWRLAASVRIHVSVTVVTRSCASVS
jgi:hypothetical protein